MGTGAKHAVAGVKAICLAGPTAAGKTAVALDLATQAPIEIVSVDSALVYRGMDIGTAKPSAAERALVPHHLIDVIDPAEAYSAARFAAEAGSLIERIRERGRLPVLVGGTMLYFKALREGLDEMPPAEPALRRQIDDEAAARGWPAMHAELARVDPVTAARLAPNDAQRIQRALEVQRATGLPLSAWQRRAPRSAAEALPMVALEPASRGWLHERIAARFAAMLDAGLVDEVQRLRSRGDLHDGLPSMRCVGYRQAWQALDEAAGGGLDEGAMQRLRERGIAATRQLAKRQITWLRSTPRTVVAADADDALPRAREALLRLAATAC